MGKRRAGAEDGAGLGAEAAGSQLADIHMLAGEDEAESSAAGGGGGGGGGGGEGGGGPLRVPAGRCGAKRVALSRAELRPWVACELSSVASLLRGVRRRITLARVRGLGFGFRPEAELAWPRYCAG